MLSKKSAVNLKGSVEIITEFLYYAMNSILYQRGIYPSETFEQVKKYGLTLLVTNDNELKKYLNVNLNQLREFLLCRNIDKIAMEITNVYSKETVEKWDFNIDCDRNVLLETEIETDVKEIQEGIRGVIRQITSSISFLPVLDGIHTFDLLLYTDKNTALPSNKWTDAKPHYTGKGEKMKLRSIATGLQNVDTVVTYKSPE